MLGAADRLCRGRANLLRKATGRTGASPVRSADPVPRATGLGEAVPTLVGN
jgi:hypothetical protein